MINREFGREIREARKKLNKAVEKVVLQFNEAKQNAISPDMFTLTVEQGYSNGKIEVMYFEINPN